MSQLRPYQAECVEHCLSQLRAGVRRQLVSLPVGSGKTTVFAHLLRRVPPPAPTATKTLVLAHREELIDQAATRIYQTHPDLAVDVEQGGRSASTLADVIVASVPTLGRGGSDRVLKYDPRLFKCIVVDEAHHATAQSYLRTLDHFGARDPASPLLLWGCSATLRRFDGVGLDAVFERVVFHRSMLDMMRERWLCPLRVMSVATRVDLSGVRVSSTATARTAAPERDFVLSQLARAINTPSRNRIVVDMWRELAGTRRSTLVFAVDVAHIRALVDAFRAAGVAADSVDGYTARDDRADVLQRFREGSLPVLVNCGVLTEGTDIPTIDCVVMARPTRSSVLFQQMLGRGLRLASGKTDCLVLDLVDSFAGKTLITVPSLLGLDPEFAMAGEDVLATYDTMRAAARQTGLAASAKSLPEALRRVTSVRELDPFGTAEPHTDVPAGALPHIRHSHYAWVRLSEHEYVLDAGHQGVLLRIERDADTGKYGLTRRQRLRNGVLTQPTRLPAAADSLESILHAADTYITANLRGCVRLLSAVRSTLLRSAPWRQQPASDGQLKFLRRLGVTRFKTDEQLADMTRGEAQRLIVLLTSGVGKTAPTLAESHGRVLDAVVAR